MSEELVTIELNGEEVEAKPGSMLIELTDQLGIQVPRFCYHKKLSVAANCRMCLVEVERAPKPMPACATPVTPGMKVWTRTYKAIDAQRANMEFLLINHPLDCPICDQGGECELQDVSVQYGNAISKYSEVKRVVMDKDIGPLIATEMTRCIQCTRCVRFGEEISGLRELGATGRGERMAIGTYVEKSLTSELSGNVIDICPVGALTAKPSRYKARAWEIIQHPTIAPHDSVGSNLFVHTFQKKVVRVVPDENEAINECWISDRDRFSYEGLYTKDRLKQPMVKVDGKWQPTDWESALAKAVECIQSSEADDTGVWVSQNATTEEMYLLQKLARSLGVNSIESRLQQTDFSQQAIDPVSPSLGISIEELEQQQAVLLIGSDVRRDQPMLNHRIRKSVLSGGGVAAINPYTVDFNYDVEQLAGGVSAMIDDLAAIAKACGNLPESLASLVKQVDKSHQAIADLLNDADNAVILIGNIAQQHPEFSTLRALAESIHHATGAKLGYLPTHANSVGAWLTGCIPHRNVAGQQAQGDNLNVMFMHSKQTLLMFDLEPEFDCNLTQRGLAAAHSARHVISFARYLSDEIQDYSDVILPIAAFAETSGTYVNAEGCLQSFRGAAQAHGDARPAWKVLRVLGNMLEVDGFDYMSSDDVLNQFKADIGMDEGEQYAPKSLLNTHTIDNKDAETHSQASSNEFADLRPGGLQRIGVVHPLATDPLVRRAKALQAFSQEQHESVYMNAQDLAGLHLNNGGEAKLFQGDGLVRVTVREDDAIPDGHVLIYAGTVLSSKLGDAYGNVQIQGV